MSTTTVVADGYTVDSTHESAEDVKSAFTSTEEKSEPRTVKDRGKEEPEKEGISKAASELGKKGGKAAAAARKAAEKEKADGPDADRPRSDSEVGRTGEEEAVAEGEEAEPEADARKENPRHSAQARIRELAEERRRERDRADRLEREAAEARREAAELRARHERPEARTEERQQAAPDLPPGFPAKPQSGDFEDYEDYLEARDMWRDALRDYRQAEAAHRVRLDYAEHQRKTAFSKSFGEAAAKIQDFRERVSPDVLALEVSSTVTARRERPTGANWIADELFSAPESAPALALYLSEHPQELQRIAALQSPRAVTRELAKLDAKLSDAATAGPSSEREVSKAKPPVTPVTGSPHTADDPSDEDSYDEHVRKMNAKERRVRR